jgi:sulfatase modifying factor 1
MSRRSAAPALALVASIGAACAYNAHFEDCTVRCDPDGAACPDGLSCGAEGLCRAPGTIGTCSMVLGDASVDTVIGDARVDAAPAEFASCVGLAPTCGSSDNDNCCDTALPVPGGTYYRSYDVASDAMYANMSFPATVSPFLLDKYEVSVGRFRKFVEAGMGTQANPPAAGAGAHPNIPDSGWDPSWDTNLAVDTASLSSNCTFGEPDNRPVACVGWYEAMAFCIWDGGFLPTEAEWNFAAAGGSDQRAYPWSSPPGALTIGCVDAYYNAPCTDSGDVGAESPSGDGKWGHADLGGNVWEWMLDWQGSAYVLPCTDCASLQPSTNRVIRGGSFEDGATLLRTGDRNGIPPLQSAGNVGLRCARPQ